MIDFIAVGSPLVDTLAQVEDSFIDCVGGAKGGMELLDHPQMVEINERLGDNKVQVAGGSAANTIVGLAKLGFSTTLIGKVNDDEVGNYYIRDSAACGVDTSRVKFSDETPSGQCISLVTPDSERTCRTYLGAASELNPSEIQAKDFEGVRHAHLEGYMLFNRELAIKTLKAAKEAGCVVSIDLASFEVVHANADILTELLKNYVDIVFANEDEAEAFIGEDNPEKALQELGSYCETAVVKIGPKGAWLKRGEEVVFAHAIEADAIDSTGAGDLWASGFLCGLYKNQSLKTCGEYGALLGKTVVEILGARIDDNIWTKLKEDWK